METATAMAQPDATGFVLAGGRSSRMGTDKALVRLNGRPLVAYAVQILQQAGLSATIAGGQPALAAFARVIEDEQGGLGPLSGICAAIGSTSARWSIFLPVDLPLTPSSLVVYLLRHARATGCAITIPSVNGFAQTFPAVVDRAAFPTLQTELKAGRKGCFAGFQAGAERLGQAVTVIPVEPLVQCGQIVHPLSLPAAWWFHNVNTAEDLGGAEIHLHRFIA